MNSKGELATPLQDLMKKVSRSGTEIEVVQSGAKLSGPDYNRPMNQNLCTPTLGLDSFPRRQIFTKKRRVVIDNNGSINSTVSSCDSDSWNRLSTVPDSFDGSNKSSQSKTSSSCHSSGTKKRRFVIDNNGSIKSTVSSCDSDSWNRLSTVPDSFDGSKESSQ